jgi:hypothetical protein
MTRRLQRLELLNPEAIHLHFQLLGVTPPTPSSLRTETEKNQLLDALLESANNVPLGRKIVIVSIKPVGFGEQ